ncbi:MAG: polyprenyl synthetase family protein [Erythrobacter sp.]
MLAEASGNALGDEIKRVQSEIDSLFDALLPVPDDTSARLVEAMRYAAIGGGKRVRPLLVCSTAALFGVSRDAALRAGAAIEAIHVYSLIHDDLPCMDNDDLRHGKPTLHKAYDEATAVLAGDALHALAFEILADDATSEDPFTRSELILTLGQASGMSGMAGGQMMDMVADEEGVVYDLQAITKLQQLKTGALLAASVEMGAILGKVPPQGRAHLRAYARDIGLAFQIADDLLDVEGDIAKAGKALRKDNEQGKQTFVTLMGVDQAREQARALVVQAVLRLASYGSEADILRALARFIVERDR